MNSPIDMKQLQRPSPSYQDILRGDGAPVPEVLTRQSNPPQSLENIAFSRYTSRAFFDAEMEKVWRVAWQYACREEHIPNPGDYYVYDIGRISLVIVRTESGAIKAYHNSCLHRGTKLKPSESSGWSPTISCPYHGWTWSLEGELSKVPCAWDFPHLDKSRERLPEVRVDTWNSLVFVSMAKEGPSLMEYLDVMPEHFKNWDMTDWVISVHSQKELECNWKAALEAFIEAYHTAQVHPQTVPTSGDTNQQHDIFSDHISRDLVALGIPSPSYEKPMTQQDILDQMLMGDRAMVGDRLMVPEGMTARQVMADVLRRKMTEEYGLDVSGYSVAEMIDSIKYTVFPNLFIFAGVSLKILYQYRPLGHDQDRCLFDIMFLRPVPKGQPRPAPAEPVRITEAESYADVPGMDPGFGLLFDQDTSIMRAQREGMYASEKGGGTYSFYLESKLRHLHHVIDKYLAA